MVRSTFFMLLIFLSAAVSAQEHCFFLKDSMNNTILSCFATLEMAENILEKINEVIQKQPVIKIHSAKYGGMEYKLTLLKKEDSTWKEAPEKIESDWLSSEQDAYFDAHEKLAEKMNLENPFSIEIEDHYNLIWDYDIPEPAYY